MFHNPDPVKIVSQYYKFAPTLMYYLPRPTVDMLCELGRMLDPSKLIPALMRYADSRNKKMYKGTSIAAPGGPSNSPNASDDDDDDDGGDEHERGVGTSSNHAIRYLEHMTLKLKNKDPAVHNYLISLYAQQKNGGDQLERFITGQSQKIYFDYKYALRGNIINEKKKRESERNIIGFITSLYVLSH